MIIHLVARALPGQKPFADPRAAWWLMWRLRIAYPGALCACVMPEHLHQITETDDPHGARVRLAKILAVATVRAGRRRVFESVAEPQPMASGLHLERSVRYLHLNPCRAGLVADPLCWPWSTHRGLVGAELDPWVTPGRLARALGRPERSLPEWLHRYVSSDPTVRVEGTELLPPAPPASVPRHGLEEIRRAALSASPWSTPHERRRLVVGLALHQGWSDTRIIALAAQLARRSVQRAVADRAGVELAARMCLADPRLLLPEGQLRPLTRCSRWTTCMDPAARRDPLRAA